MMPIGPNKAVQHAVINTFAVMQTKNSNIKDSITFVGQEKNQTRALNKSKNSEQARVKNTDNYLSAEKIQKMLLRLLTETPISKQKLAEALGITVKSLSQLCSSKAAAALILKINLSLIKLYCATKFQQPTGENKDAISKFKKYV